MISRVVSRRCLLSVVRVGPLVAGGTLSILCWKSSTSSPSSSGSELAPSSPHRPLHPHLYPSLGSAPIAIRDFIAQFSKCNQGEKLDQIQVKLAGRVSSKREYSAKLIFYHIDRDSERVQLQSNIKNFRKKSSESMDDAAVGTSFIELHKSISRGDIVEAIGFPGRTDRGELTLYVQEMRLLAPAIQDFSKSSKGFTDVEKRFRERHVDMLVHPHVIKIFEMRSKVLGMIRSFLDSRGFLEVDTPTLSPIAGGASAEPFETTARALDDAKMNLRIAPELFLKRLVVGGMDKVYEMGKQFRNEGIDASHNPEFTTCEFYQAYATHEDLFSVTEEMLHNIVVRINGSPKIKVPWLTDDVMIDFTPPFRRIDIVSTMESRVGMSLSQLLDPETLSQTLRNHNISCGEPRTLARMWDKMISHFLEPECIQPTFLCGHPLVMSPLAKSEASRPQVSARFELFIGGREFVNAYSELNDPEEQRRRFRDQAKDRECGDHEAQVLDEEFCKALEYGLPPTAGWGLGVDRLVLLLAQQRHLREVLTFPLMKVKDQSHS